MTLTWTASAGLVYRVQYKNNLSDVTWQTLGSDVTASGTIATKVDTGFLAIPQRYYRILLVN